jgi:hypothetical protein
MLAGLNDHTTGCATALLDKSTMANFPLTHIKIRSLDGHQETDQVEEEEEEETEEEEEETEETEEVEELEEVVTGVVVVVASEVGNLDKDADAGTDFM